MHQSQSAVRVLTLKIIQKQKDVNMGELKLRNTGYVPVINMTLECSTCIRNTRSPRLRAIVWLLFWKQKSMHYLNQSIINTLCNIKCYWARKHTERFTADSTTCILTVNFHNLNIGFFHLRLFVCFRAFRFLLFRVADGDLEGGRCLASQWRRRPLKVIFTIIWAATKNS